MSATPYKESDRLKAHKAKRAAINTPRAPVELALVETDDEEIQIHSGCGGGVLSVGEDGISYCEACEHVCEGETEYILLSEYERRS